MQSHVPSSFMLRSFSGNSGAPLPPLTFASELTPYFFANSDYRHNKEVKSHSVDNIIQEIEFRANAKVFQMFIF